MERTLFIVRGLPGSGKTTLAHRLSDNCFAADDYFVGRDGVYRFDPARIKAAHLWCQDRAEHAMMRNEASVCVHNTFTQQWEVEPYISMANEHGYRVTFISLFDAGMSDAELVQRNVHGVPVEAIARMRARYEHSIRKEV